MIPSGAMPVDLSQRYVEVSMTGLCPDGYFA